jgi:hypothetical protein
MALFDASFTGIGGLVAATQVSNARPPRRGPVFQQELPDLALHGWSLTTVEDYYAPATAHRHPGLTFAYVLEAEIFSRVGDEPDKTYATGEMWMETPGQLHTVSRNANSTKPARRLAILLAEKEKATNESRLNEEEATRARCCVGSHRKRRPHSSWHAGLTNSKTRITFVPETSPPLGVALTSR